MQQRQQAHTQTRGRPVTTGRPNAAPVLPPVQAGVLDLQRQAGNRAVAELVRSVQRNDGRVPIAVGGSGTRVPIKSGGGSTGGRVPIASGGGAPRRVPIASSRPTPTPVEEIGIIGNDLEADGGVRVHDQPWMEPAATTRHLPYNQQVYIHASYPGNWFRVVGGGVEGYIAGEHLKRAADMPDPGSKLHRVAPNETAFDIVVRAYGADAMVAGSDARFYSNVLVYANEERKRGGIRKPTKSEKQRLIKAHGGGKYLDAWTVAGEQIWVPSKVWADTMKGTVSAGSFRRDAWEKMKSVGLRAAEFLVKIPAFIGGLLVGVIESVIDAVKAIVDLVKSIVTGSIVDDIKALVSAVSDKTTRDQLLEALADQLAAKWDNPNPIKKWYWRGWLIGYVVGEVLGVVLTAGAGTALKASKFGVKAASIVKSFKPVQAALAVAAKVKAAAPVVKAAEIAGKVKGLPGAVVEKFIDAAKSGARSVANRVRKRSVSPAKAAKAAAKVKAMQKLIATMAGKYGFQPQRLAKFLETAIAYDLRIWLRKGNRASVRHLDAGALPKPATLKAKTISDVDLQLNPKLKADDVGLVGYFEPRMPDRPAHLTKAQWKKHTADSGIDARFKERQAEFKDQADLMSVLSKKANHPARRAYKDAHDSLYQVKVENGVVRMIDTESGKVLNVAGDIDVLQITKADGKVLGRRGSGIDDALLELDLTEHGPHLWWKPSKRSDFDIDFAVLNKHASGDLLEVSSAGLREVDGAAVPGFAKRLKLAGKRASRR